MSRSRYAALVACLLFVSVQSMDGKEISAVKDEVPSTPVVPPASVSAPTMPAVSPTTPAASVSPIAPAASGSTSSAATGSTTSTPPVNPPGASSAVAPPAVAPAADAAAVVEVQQTVESMEPHKRPVPAEYAAAGELFKQRKFALAQKAFEKIIQSGKADINTHLCLAHCFLQQKLYTKAFREFDWLSKYAKNSISLKRSCQATADALRCHLNGVCPSTCIKATDGGWYIKGGHRWKDFPAGTNGRYSWSDAHIGDLVVYEKGIPINKGKCPTCEGSGHVDVLKDGLPMPRL
ncbi:MAG: hypothetical protein IAF58_20020 [Leptolyngbya sp.]|nr:hypothetical protein [Candidatus Melainabacteria bacterium]